MIKHIDVKRLDLDAVKISDRCIFNYNAGVVFLDGDQVKSPPKSICLLRYLIENNGRVLENKQILNSVWGYDYGGEGSLRSAISILYDIIGEKPGKNSVLQNCRGIGYRLDLPEQDEDDNEETDAVPGCNNTDQNNDNIKPVGEHASSLWRMRPFYMDEGMIKDLFNQNGWTLPEGDYDENIYRLGQLEKNSYKNGKEIDLKGLNSVPKNKLASFGGKFLLKDIYANKKHMKDFKDPLELLDVDEERITFFFTLKEGSIEVNMMLGAEKAFFPIRHLIPIIFESDKVFNFKILGFVDEIKKNNYSIKPVSIAYVNL